MLKVPKVDGDLQLVPLVRQAETFCLEAGINAGKLSSKPTQGAHRLPKKLMADDTPFVRKLECTANSVLRSGGRRRDPKRLARFPREAGGCPPPPRLLTGPWREPG